MSTEYALIPVFSPPCFALKKKSGYQEWGGFTSLLIFALLTYAGRLISFKPYSKLTHTYKWNRFALHWLR